jgi:hypothetical protein
MDGPPRIARPLRIGGLHYSLAFVRQYARAMIAALPDGQGALATLAAITHAERLATSLHANPFR